jgi:glutamine amidotransferase-like uncharacterized protein
MTKSNEKVPNNQKIIKIAILSKEPFFWKSRKYYHYAILNNYTWRTHNNNYRISVKYVNDKDIIKGKLILDNFNVLLVPGGGVGNNQALLKGFNCFRKIRIFKKNITDFIKNGGGYVGVCGGAALMTKLVKDNNETLTSISEKLYNKSSLGASCVSSYFKNLAFPIFYPFQYKHPEKIGNSAYAFSSAPGGTVDGKFIHSTGCSLDLQIFKDNEIFYDFKQNSELVRWWAGQALIIPENPDREVRILARYPNDAASDNDNTTIYAWRYIGGIKGILKAVIKSLNFIKNNNLGLNKLPIFTFYFAGDWELTNKKIELNLSNKPCITSEIYPNENKGRIILSSVHPEYMIWRGGHIDQQDPSGYNCIGTGLYKWKNIDKLSNTLENELTYNWWILRRFIAWCAKIPKSELPPIEKGKDGKRAKEILKNKIYWDGSLLNQIDNI